MTDSRLLREMSLQQTAMGHTASDVLDSLDRIDGRHGIRCFRCLSRIEMPLPHEKPTFAVIGQVWHGEGASLEVPVMMAGMLCRRCRDSWLAWRDRGTPHDGKPCPTCGAWDHAGCALAEDDVDAECVSYARAT